MINNQQLEIYESEDETGKKWFIMFIEIFSAFTSSLSDEKIVWLDALDDEQVENLFILFLNTGMSEFTVWLDDEAGPYEFRFSREEGFIHGGVAFKNKADAIDARLRFGGEGK